MKIKVHKTEVICQNPNNPFHNYFAWPTVTRLQDGRLAMVASGFRVQHVCPFGKVVMCVSEDEGATWSLPTPVLDTPLDDRDGGILPFGENSVLVTSFNNDAAVQKRYNPDKAYFNAYLDTMLTPELTGQYLGSTMVVSHDGGRHFGPVYKLPVTSPHGPCLTPDGHILYVGTYFDYPDGPKHDKSVACYEIWPDGRYALRGEIENCDGLAGCCEPHAICLPDGKIIVHIRVSCYDPAHRMLTLYQSESTDGGRHFTTPKRLLPDLGGAPAYLTRLRDGTLLCLYGYREKPYGIRAMVSRDDGETWQTDLTLYEDGPTDDLGYPSTVEREDGRLLTVFYSHQQADGPAVICQTLWELERD